MNKLKINERLREARERSGFTLREVEERAGIGSSSLSDFERAVREPSLSQLNALAKVYHVPISSLLEDEVVADPVVLWRARPGDDAIANEIKNRFLELSRQYSQLEAWCEEHRPASLPEWTETNERVDVELLAAKVQKELDLGNRPGPSLLRVLEEVCGVRVFHYKLGANCAACTVDRHLGYAILLNSESNRTQRNFDLAHELFHLLTWRAFRHEIPPTPGADEAMPEAREEDLADRFARALLMPRDAVRESVLRLPEKMTFDDLFDVARQFDVEVEVLIARIGDVYSDLLTPGAVSTIIVRYRETARARHQAVARLEPRDPIPNRPLRFRSLAMRALHAGEVSQGTFGTYLEMSRREVMKLVDQELQTEQAGDDEEVTLAPA